MRDVINLKTIKPFKAEGKVCIDLTDPVTGKVKERVEGKNHIFENSLFSEYSGDQWLDRVSKLSMCLNDSSLALDTSIPYLMGQTIGYGVPSLGSLGTYRGAYNAANQVLASLSTSSVRWKFQYDFTTAQANSGTIRNVGLTSQYFSAVNPSTAAKSPGRPISGFKIPANTTTYSYTNDGRYAYSCSTAGIITKYDLWFGTSSTIDVSATTGTVSGTSKTIGYAVDTGKYYIWCYSSTAGNRKMYRFSNNTFGTLETTYSPSNISISNQYGLYIEGNFVYSLNYSDIYYADFVNNVAYSTWTPGTKHNATYNEGGTSIGTFYRGSCPLGGYLMIGISGMSSSPWIATEYILKLSTQTIVGYHGGIINSTTAYSGCLYPVDSTTEKLICLTNGDTYGALHTAAATTYILTSPITKTSANGMTATYELEVFW